MILRQKDNLELWSSCHPLSVGCVAEGREVCDCGYHLINRTTNEIKNYDDFKEAEAEYCSLTGEESFTSIFIKKI